MAKTLFVTATGTDIGKTYISALIVKKMREFGYDCGYFKPVLSGVKENNGKLIQSDCNYVVKMAGIPIEPDECVSYYWKEAVSPHLAAKRDNQIIYIEKIKTDFNNKSSQYDYLLIEGAGGITCPLNLDNGNKYILSDLISELSTPIIIVADGGLGTINSTILTVEYALSRNIKINGIVLNNFESDNFMHQDNLKQVKYLTGINVVATVSRGANEIKLLNNLFE